MKEINKQDFEKLLIDGYGVQAITCYMGINKGTLTSWARRQYGKTVLELRELVKAGDLTWQEVNEK